MPRNRVDDGPAEVRPGVCRGAGDPAEDGLHGSAFAAPGRTDVVVKVVLLRNLKRSEEDREWHTVRAVGDLGGPMRRGLDPAARPDLQMLDDCGRKH
jgi:hypothetical protein